LPASISTASSAPTGIRAGYDCPTDPLTEQEVRALIADHFGVEADRVADAAEFDSDLGADSLDVIELTMLIETAVGVPITPEEGESCACVGDLLRLISEKRVVSRRTPISLS
jgi:acyl carrier protein